jgi:hypothetical protein
MPQLVQRAPARNLSLEASDPHPMTATAQASGAWCWQRSHHNHTQGVDRCSSPRVGGGPGWRMVDNSAAGWPLDAGAIHCSSAGSVREVLAGLVCTMSVWNVGATCHAH